jgi:hypothetical protein
MTGIAMTLAVVAAIAGIGALVLALLLARRYRELRDALLASGTVRTPGAAPLGRVPGELWIPDPGFPVPADLSVPTTDGPPVLGADFAGDDVVLAFLTSQCTSCRASLAELRDGFAALPATAPRPVVVLSGSPVEWPEYRRELAGLARIVQDGDERTGGVATLFGVRSYPAVLVVGGGVVRRAGMTASDVALVPAAS